MTDTELIRLFLGGNIHAFNQLVWRYETPVYNFILKTVSNEALAKDLCQIVFVKVYRQLRQIKDPACFPSWIYRIAYRTCCDEFRKRKKAPTLSLNADEAEGRQPLEAALPHSDKTPEESLEFKQLQQILKTALNRLPEEQRIVVLLKQYQGLKFHEIAAVLDVPMNTVKSRMYYGLKAMRKFLEASGFNMEDLLYDM